MEASQPGRTVNNHAGLIWSIADLLRGDYKQSEYGRVILPLVLLRRLDCVLEPTKDKVLARAKALTVDNVGPILTALTGVEAYNASPLTLHRILADPSQVAGNLRAWIAAFDPDTRDVIEKFDCDQQIGRLDRAHILYLVLSKVTEVDLHPDTVRFLVPGDRTYEALLASAAGPDVADGSAAQGAAVRAEVDGIVPRVAYFGPRWRWLADALETMRSLFGPLVKTLDAREAPNDAGDGDAPA